MSSWFIAVNVVAMDFNAKGNSLPAKVISLPTVALFKKSMDDFWKITGYGHCQRPMA